MIRTIFLTSGTVSRALYIQVGCALMTVKFGAEALLGYSMTGAWPSPLVYVAPSLTLRNSILGSDPTGWMHLGLALWTLPFAWVGVAMSVRRARDAGLSGAVGLGFLLPVINYLFMVMLSAMPSKPLQIQEQRRAQETDELFRSALLGVFVGALILLIFVGITASVLSNYGGGVFLGAPFLTGAIASFVYCRQRTRGVGEAMAIGVFTQLLAGLLLLLFAAEGVICLAMAMPLACAAGAMGGLIGRAIAQGPRSGWQQALVVPLLSLPVLTVATVPEPTLRMVETAIEVDASPERVWELVVAFPDIPSDTTSHILFQAGVAMPLRARIVGRGVGAVRHCEFTTGAFVEPITVWDPPHHLAFDVTEQPEPMKEMSFWRHVHAPHLVNGTLRSERGEFRLKRLAGNRTRLIGRTWYRISMGPEAYWATWVDVVIHQVHRRVLGHIARVAHLGNRLARTRAVHTTRPQQSDIPPP